MNPRNEKERGIELLERALERLRYWTGLNGRILQMQPLIVARNKPTVELPRRRIMLDHTLDDTQTAPVAEHKPIGNTEYRPDALIEIAVGDRKLQFVVEVKRIDRFELVTQIRACWPVDAQPPLLLVAPYITAKTAERCRKLKLFFLDAAGHAYIDVPGLYMFVTEPKRPATPHADFPDNRGRIAKPAALKIVFAVLCRPQLLAGTYREIAAVARVALGTVGGVMRELQARKHVAIFRTTHDQYPHLRAFLGIENRKLLDPERLLKEWVEFYAATLRPKLNVRRFRAPNMEWTETADLRQYGAYWGGEVAAKRITDYLKPETATIYVTHPPTRLIVDNRLRADVNGNVEILDVFWNPDKIPHAPDLVPPILTYADLMATTEGRNLEAAKLIYDEHIAPNLHRTTR
jgi:hypothetical protein